MSTAKDESLRPGDFALLRKMGMSPRSRQASEPNAASKPRKEIKLQKLLELSFHALLPKQLKQLGCIAALADAIKRLAHFLCVT